MSTVAATPQALQHVLLRPCILEILRAAGFQSAKPSVADAVTDMATRYLRLLAETTAQFAATNHYEYEITITDLRMAMEQVGAITFGKSMEDQQWEGEEDLSGVEEFINWCNGPQNQEIRRIAKDTLGEDGADYVTALKRKQTKTNDDTRYQGTILGKPLEPRPVVVEGGPVTSLGAWEEEQRKKQQQKTQSLTTNSSRRASSTLTSLEDSDVGMALEFENHLT